MTDKSGDDSQKIAVIGMSCRLPGADNPSELWNILSKGEEALTEFTDEQLAAAGVPKAEINSPNYVKRRGIIKGEGAQFFDAGFFDVTPRDAEIMDPQHRVFLECTWHSLEDAGINPDKTKDRIGVFGGCGTNWHMSHVSNNEEAKKFASGTSIVTGNDKDYLATRISYKLNLTGPSLTVQSACSTSMAAVVMGIGSLQSYQSDIIIAGGSTIELPEHQGYMYLVGGLESSDGHCRAFDKDADGTIFSRGAGAVILKRYEDAVRDGDNIHAVLLSGAINNDGSSKVGFTAPSVEGQVDVATEAIEMAGIEAESITMVEAHGTGTSVGDPIEVTSLSQVFQSYTDRKQFCSIGSVKTNIGHTDSASGVAGLIKTILSIKNKKIPAHLHFKEPNPKINFETSPFYVNTETVDWHTVDNAPRRALVNSFGVGGTNACVIIEEAPSRETLDEKKERLLILSARSEESLASTRENLATFLKETEEVNLSDLSYSYSTGRKSFHQRAVLSYRTKEELIEKLEENKGITRGVSEKDDNPVIFMFPGQGNQYLNMGRDLYNENEEYRKIFDYCCDFLKEKLSLDLREYLFVDEATDEAKAMIEQTKVTQPAIFVVSYAMGKILQQKGVNASAMIGHSVGEYVAACMAGVMSLEDALLLVAKRGQLVQDLPGGSMLAVLENEEKIIPMLEDGVEVAAVNNPGLTVVAGPDDKITAFEEKLKNAGYFFKQLSTSHAFHSAMMDDCLPDFRECFENVTLNAPEIPILSTVTGNLLKADEAMNPEYWVRHVRESVRFTDAVQTALDMTTSVFFEIGPGQSLESAVKRHLTKETEHTACRSMRAETETFNDTTFFTEAIGYLWMNGGMVDWETYYKDQTRNYISLPGYPFERQPYSIDFSASIIGKVVEEAARYEEVKDWYSTPSWKRTGPVQIVENEEVAQTWLLFKDELGLKEQIETQLLEKDHRAITVVFGDKYSKIGENSYMVMMDDRDNYEQLVSDIFADNTTQITHIVDLTDYSKPTALGELDLDAVENASFFSMLYLSQALYTFNKLKTIHLSVVSNGSIEVTGGEVTSPEKSLNVGNCRVLMQEFHDTRAKYIDADLLETTDKRMKTLATNIIAETTSESYEAVVGYRNGHRWKEEFDKVDYVTEQNRQLRENGKYLITGGLGGIGILTAKMISDQVKAEFILTFHSAIPEKSTWNAWLKEQNDDEFIREKIEGVLEIEAKGSTVHLRQINVADFDAMNTMVTEFEAEHGAINGVIHSAGTSGGGIIPLKTAESSRPVLDSKFRGTLVLDKVFDGKELDFMLLYSSITSILGEATRLDYCSANTFLDSYAHYRNARHGDQVAASINWSGWEGLGMSTRWEKRKSAAASITKLRASKEFLKRIHSDDASEIFDVTFSPTNDWIINSHFIVGQPTVVGTTFIELAHQYVQEYHSEKSVELKNLFFMSPLMFENGKHKRTRLFIDKKGGKFKFYYKTQPIDKDPDADIWHDHFMGEMIFMDRKPKSVDLEDIKKRLGSERIDSKSPRVVYNSQNKPLIELGERWDIDNDIYVGESEWLAHLKLRKEFAGDTDFFDYHPAIMDKATSFGLRFISDSTFLPFSYKNVIPYKKLPAEVFAYARVNKAATQGGTVAIDITMISEEGVVLMEIEQYTMKQVNDLPSSAPEKGTKEENAEIVLKELDFIRPDEGEQVLKQILNGVSSSQLIVYPCDFNFMVKDTIPDPLKLQREREKKKEAKKNYYTRPTMETAYEEPETEIEITMAEIWRDILGIDKIGRNDTFAELGGNSLLAIQAIANIADVLEVEITAQVFYENPTIRGLAEAVITSIMDFSEMDDIEGLLAALDEN